MMTIGQSIGAGAVAAMFAVIGSGAFAGDWADRLDASFAMGSDRSIMSPNDLGMVNGHVTFRGRVDDVAAVDELYAAPYHCRGFRLGVSFGGVPVACTDYVWRPEVLARRARQGGWGIETRLYPLAGARGGILAIDLTNDAGSASSIDLGFSIEGAVGYQTRWDFSKPSGRGLEAGFETNGLYSICSPRPGKVTVSLPSGGSKTLHVRDVRRGERRTFHVVFAIGAPEEADAVVRTARADPAAAIANAVSAWKDRVRDLAAKMPELESDGDWLVALYDRSLIHLLLNEWNADEFVLKPFYATGGMCGGCTCNYLWNYGGPYRLWPMLGADSCKAHIRAFLSLDLMRCYAFSPVEGAPLGPYYPINQEKMIFLIDAYVRESGDRAYLAETVCGKPIIRWVVDFALAHDDLGKPAVLADYGSAGASHLELRRGYRYDGVMPDLNLRRVALLHMADRLCRIAGYDPGVDLPARAAALKDLIRAELWDPEAGWFRAICSDGRPTIRWTMQMFKALGYGEDVMDVDIANRLVGHLMDESEFLGPCGVHSLSKKDVAYDEKDVDNGGPGACPSFAPAICDRLYRDGRVREANEILRRLSWLAEALPYWGDSQYADRRDYRRDTPLQCDVEGACLAQTILFGVFGISVGDDFAVSVEPHLPDGVNRMALRNVRLAGRTFDVSVVRGEGVRVTVGGRTYGDPGRIVLDN